MAFSFRRRALEGVSSPEDLDRLVRVALPRTWVALGGLGLLIVTAAVWAAVARVPTTVKGPGYLLHGRDPQRSRTDGRRGCRHPPPSGRHCRRRRGTRPRARCGRPLVAARSPSSGKVIEVSVGLGDYLDAGRPLALVDPAAQPEVVYAYLPQSDAKEAHVGDRVQFPRPPPRRRNTASCSVASRRSPNTRRRRNG